MSLGSRVCSACDGVLHLVQHSYSNVAEGKKCQSMFLWYKITNSHMSVAFQSKVVVVFSIKYLKHHNNSSFENKKIKMLSTIDFAVQSLLTNAVGSQEASATC